MFELTAEGKQAEHHHQWDLQTQSTYVIGRSDSADIAIGWDPHISRKHVRLKTGDQDMEIECTGDASNPLFMRGREIQKGRLRPGECFVIGSTTFWLKLQRIEAQDNPQVDIGFADDAGAPVEEVTFDERTLRKIRFRDADTRLDVLSRLPEVILGAHTDSEFYHQLADLILTGVKFAEAVAIVMLDSAGTPVVLHWGRRRETAGEFRPSGRLVVDSLEKRRKTILHIWEPDQTTIQDYTAIAEFDWAFCTPIPKPTESAWGIYVAGRLDEPIVPTESQITGSSDLQGDIKFTELVGEIISSVRRLNRLERRYAGLSQFFAPPVAAILSDNPNADVLKPRECDVTVLFCDLRGFSKSVEESAENLTGLLERVSIALETMTDQILEHGGVTCDFQGDAVIGFWGWPFDSDDATLNAARAALGIRAAFDVTRDREDHPLAKFQMGIGIARGRAVAGKIGTTEHVKVTVFGPVVNLASRLEGLTKQLRVPIVIDEATASTLGDQLDPSVGRMRKLAKILPYGMEKPVVVSELLPAEDQTPAFSDATLQRYEQGIDHFIAGEWEQAYECLHDMPAEDRAQDFPSMLIAQHNRIAPPDWDGIVRIPNK